MEVFETLADVAEIRDLFEFFFDEANTPINDEQILDAIRDAQRATEGTTEGFEKLSMSCQSLCDVFEAFECLDHSPCLESDYSNNKLAGIF